MITILINIKDQTLRNGLVYKISEMMINNCYDSLKLRVYTLHRKKRKVENMLRYIYLENNFKLTKNILCLKIKFRRITETEY